MTTYTLTLRTLSPLHIGSGEILRENFDFAIHEKKTWRLNEDEVLRAKENQWLAARGSYPPPGKMLAPADFQNPQLFRYSMRGFPRSNRTYAELREFIKDVYDRPYIPGSSLKGAFRTALAWTGWNEINPRLDRNAIGRNKSWAGHPLEQKLFGNDPNHDLLRALHVSDLHGVETAGPGLIVVNAQVVTMRKKGSPVELEALPGEIEFKGSLTIDETLFKPWAEKLGFINRKHWLDELMARTQAHSKARIDELAQWFGNADGAEKIASFYNTLAGVSPGKTQAFVQIGWGAGWDGKTFSTHLQKDKMLFEQIVSDFRMHKTSRDNPSRRSPGDAFPRSKRVVVKDTLAAAPFGWALLELLPKG